jgi:hypothetical protein
MPLIEKTPVELLDFEQRFTAISDSIQKSDIKWYFDCKLYEFESLPVLSKEIVTHAYPRTNYKQASLERKTFAEMLARLNEEFSAWPHAKERNDGRVPSIITEYSDVWFCLTGFIDFAQAHIYEYSPTAHSDPFGKSGLFRSFAFIVKDESSHHLLF